MIYIPEQYTSASQCVFNIPENRINILSLISNSVPNIDNNNTDPRILQNINEEINSNYYFRDFLETDSSPEINLTKIIIDKFVQNEKEGFYNNIITEDGQLRFISDPVMNYFAELLENVHDLEDRYTDIINFLKCSKNLNLESKFTPFDLPDLKLGKRKFFKEFNNFVKIAPKTNFPSDYIKLNMLIRDILLEDSYVKLMSHWDLHIFNKFYLSFAVDDENLDSPYIKVYTRDKSEAAQLSFNLMDKDYVEII